MTFSLYSVNWWNSFLLVHVLTYKKFSKKQKKSSMHKLESFHMWKFPFVFYVLFFILRNICLITFLWTCHMIWSRPNNVLLDLAYARMSKRPKTRESPCVPRLWCSMLHGLLIWPKSGLFTGQNMSVPIGYVSYVVSMVKRLLIALTLRWSSWTLAITSEKYSKPMLMILWRHLNINDH